MDLTKIFNERIDKNFPTASKAQKKVIFDMLNNNTCVCKYFGIRGDGAYHYHPSSKQVALNLKFSMSTLNAMIVSGDILVHVRNEFNGVTKHIYRLKQIEL
jgi:hypothetical protein